MLVTRYRDERGRWCKFEKGKKMQPFVFEEIRHKGKVVKKKFIASGKMKVWNRRGKTGIVAIDSRGHFQKPTDLYYRAYIYWDGVQIRQLKKNDFLSEDEYKMIKNFLKQAKKKKWRKKKLDLKIRYDIYKMETPTDLNTPTVDNESDYSKFGGMVGQVWGDKKFRRLDKNKFRKIRNFWVMDTEDDSNGQVKLIVFYNGRNHKVIQGDFELDIQIKAIDFLRRLSRFKTKIFCVNLMYDLNNVFEEDYKINKMCISNSQILYVKMHFTKNDYIEFYESLRQIPLSVKKLGEAIGLKKMQVDDRVNVEYCKRDCEITYKALSKVFWFDRKYKIDFGISSASKILKFYRRNFQKKDYKFHTFEFLRAGYRGGRTEIFRIGQVENVRVYDVNSMYPYVMSKYEYPNPEFADYVTHFNPKIFGIYKARVKVKDDVLIPTLGIIKDLRFLFPIGEFVGVWTNVELNYAIEQGEIEDLEIEEGYVFGNDGYIFKDFANYFYNLRENYRSDLLLNKLCKVYMNSLYGKFAESEKHYKYNEERDVFEIVEEDFPLHTNYIWSIFVTSYARIHLKKYLDKVPYEKLIYCDTDSIHVQDFKFPKSYKLGKLKLEGEFDFGFYVAPKLYYLSGQGEQFVKAKGIPKDYALEYITTGSCKFKRPVKLLEYLRLRDSHLQGYSLNEWVWVEKEFQQEDLKRIFDKNGFSKPKKLFLA